MRISKDPDVRRHELVDAARTLFLERGYGRTSVRDIVSSVGVAQGTFYYYFKSKNDILDAVSQMIFDLLEKDIGAVFTNQDKHASGRINEMLNRIFVFRRSLDGFLELLHEESNLVLHNRLAAKTQERLARMFTRVLEEGIQSGEFSISHPDETAELLSSMMHYVWHLPLMEGERLERISKALEEILTRSMGMAEPQNFFLKL